MRISDTEVSSVLKRLGKIGEPKAVDVIERLSSERIQLKKQIVALESKLSKVSGELEELNGRNLIAQNVLTGINEHDYTSSFQLHESAADVTHPLDDRHSLWPWNNQ